MFSKELNGMGRTISINKSKIVAIGVGVVVIGVMAFGSDKGLNSSNKTKDMGARDVRGGEIGGWCS